MDARADCPCLEPAERPLRPPSCAFPLSVAWAARLGVRPSAHLITSLETLNKSVHWERGGVPAAG